MNFWTKISCAMLATFFIYLNGVYGACVSETTKATSKATTRSPFKTYSNVPSSYDGGSGSGACGLPQANYAVVYPVGLGNINELGDLKYDGDLCGRVLTINCGNGPLDVVVTNSNLGGGLNLPQSTWNKVTNNKPKGATKCSVQLSRKNPLNAATPVCYHADGQVNNQYYRNVGIFNTNGRVVARAQLKGKLGVHYGENPYYVFNFQSSSSDAVTFYFTDNSSVSVKISDCLSGANKRIWS